jgi:predicted ArsR family transcriptional regulator
MRLRSNTATVDWTGDRTGDGATANDGTGGDGPDNRGKGDVAGREARTDPLDELVDVMAQQGFEPSVREHGERIEVDLGHCPFATTALADPETVCSIHLGMAEGITEWADGLVVDELIPHDPRQGHCQLRVRRRTTPASSP